MNTIKKGSRCNDVKILLQYLKLLGYNIIADGIFGDITCEVVKDILKLNGLIPDGIVGEKTWELIQNKCSVTQIILNKRLINDIILHCSATPEGKNFTTKDIDTWHKLRGFNKIGYHYVIYLDGSINKGRDESEIGAHCVNHNSKTIGICYIGGCDSTGKKPKDTRTEKQKQSLNKLVKDLLVKYRLTINNVHCHNQYDKGKACPSFSIEEFKKEYK